ncbi:MAG TPA: hypothetical protein VNA67_00660 [Pseudonocardiaceae bacterium]|nr:hypothetical protein [Pseudonocardiaceae bacterium]
MRSHSIAVLSVLAVANMLLSGVNATDTTALLWPVRGCPTVRGRAGSVRSHRMTLRSALAVARVVPSGEIATEDTKPV